jgi:hypothetical protein
MKKTTSTLMAVAMSLGSIAFAEDKAPDRQGFAPNSNEWKIVSSDYSPGSFDQWVKDGKQIPQDMAFVGGSPSFDESTGKNRSDEEVYKIVFAKPETGGPDPKPEVEKPERPDPVGEYRRLETLIAEKKEFVERAKLTEGGLANHQGELRAMETRLAVLKKIPEVVICIFPPRPEPKPFPLHWGRPPLAQTKDLRPLPGDFGHGSSTLAAWVESNIKSDHSNKDKPKPEPKRPPVVRPLTPPRPEISQDTKDDLAKIGKDKSDLFRAMREELGKLEKDSSMADVRKAVDEFKKENADKFAAIKEAADKVHEELKAKRPERKVRPEPPAAVKAKIAEVKKVEKTLHVARKAVSDKLKEAQDELTAKIVEAKENADKEEVAINIKRLVAEQAAARKAALDEFRAAQKEKHKELKAAQKELRKEVRDTKEEGSSRSSR